MLRDFSRHAKPVLTPTFEGDRKMFFSLKEMSHEIHIKAALKTTKATKAIAVLIDTGQFENSASHQVLFQSG